MDSESKKAPPASLESSVKPPKPAGPAALIAAEPERNLRYWAGVKGHIPKKARVNSFRGDKIHRGPHIEVIEQHCRGKVLFGKPDAVYPNSILTEAQYDALVDEVANIGIGENLADAAQKVSG